jgi:hypothetical protein
MRIWLAAISLLISTLLSTAPVSAQSSLGVLQSSVNYQYGQQISFTVQFNTDQNIREAFLYLQPSGEATRLERLDLDDLGQAMVTLNVAEDPIRPFAGIRYWYQATLADGAEAQSQEYRFDYIDNRYAWESLENDQFQINWYGRDQAFGQEVMNAADIGLKSAQIYLPADNLPQIHIYVYPSVVELRQALRLNPDSWVAGHASPDMSVILISIPDGDQQHTELDRQIPHEIVHVIQYHLVGERYNLIPIWLLEGAASLAELYPNPDYARMLEQAANQQSLLPLSSLCGDFPQEASGAVLAYAEAASFVRYLHQTHGSSGILQLTQIYSDGYSCEEGTRAAFGSSLSQVEYRWQLDYLGLNAAALALEQLSPYLALLLVVTLPPVTAVLVNRKRNP